MHLLIYSLAGGVLVGLAGAFLTLALGQESRKFHPPRAAPSGANRFCTHLFYWLAALFVLWLIIQPLRASARFGILFLFAPAGAFLTCLARPAKARDQIARFSRLEQFSNAFFWWCVFGFLALLVFLPVMMKGPG